MQGLTLAPRGECAGKRACGHLHLTLRRAEFADGSWSQGEACVPAGQAATLETHAPEGRLPVSDCPPAYRAFYLEASVHADDESLLTSPGRSSRFLVVQ